MANSVCLNMIVKDEAHIIEKTLNNIIEHVPIDYWVICDTGSTDATVEIIKAFFAKKNIEGEIHSHTWKDFSHNRNLALAAAKNKADFLFIFDADDEIHGDLSLENLELTTDMYEVKFGGGFNYIRGILLNNYRSWRYVGVLHETVTMLDQCPMKTKKLEGDYHLISGKSGNRSKNPNRYRDDAVVLSKAFETEKEEWLKIRYAFYCAQSYKDAGMIENATKWYKIRHGLDGWDQERYYAALMIGLLSKNLEDYPAMTWWLLETHRIDPSRWDGVYELIDTFWNWGRKSEAFAFLRLVDLDNHATSETEGKLFLNEEIHSFKMYWLGSFICGWMGDRDTGRKAQEAMFRSWRHIPRYYLGCVVQNTPHYLPDTEDGKRTYLECFDKFLHDCTSLTHNDHQEGLDLLGRLRGEERDTRDPVVELGKFRPDPEKGSDTIMTITSCKRFDLFKRTMNSITQMWKDLDQVGLIICIDDQSSDEDRKSMLETYPWITFVLKGEEQKGHRASMNIIHHILKEKSEVKYWIHVEDDWEFLKEDSYVEKATKWLDKYEKQNIAQILFNKGYGEIPSDKDWKGGHSLEPGLLAHVQNEEGAPCGYWPHFSFRPSVTRAEVIRKLGTFDSTNVFFEMDYANKYVQAGYKSAYFDCISCKHIGKLSGYRGSDTESNAYNLNQEGQFELAPKKRIIGETQSLVINLTRRPDRLEAFKERCPFEFTRLSAVDGEKFPTLTEKEQVILGRLEGKTHCRGETGCRLSHYRAWASASDNDRQTLVMEDDVVFSSKAKEAYNSLSLPSDIDLLYVGGQWVEGYDVGVETSASMHNLNKDFLAKAFTKTDLPGIYKRVVRDGIIDTHIFDSPLCRCAGGYIVTAKGAKKLTDLADSDIENFHSEPLDNWLSAVVQKGLVVGGDRFPHFVSQIWDPFTGNIRRETRTPFSVEEIPVSVKLIGPPGWFWDRWRTGMSGLAMAIREHFKVMSDDDGVWGNIILTTEKKADIYVVINCPTDTDYYEIGKTIVFRMEPHMETDPYYGGWSNPSPTWGFKHVHYHKFYLNPAQTQFRIPDEIDLTEKKALVSSIQASSYSRTGHKLRVDFLKYANKHSPDLFHIYGRENYHNLDGYKGQLADNKKDGFLKYRYYFMAESESYDNYATEKIWEPILCECLCFYWGCPNLGQYIDERAFVRLDLDDLEGSLEIVKKAISENWWEKRLPYIREAKKLFQEKYGFFPVIDRIIKGTIDDGEERLEEVFETPVPEPSLRLEIRELDAGVEVEA